MSEDKYRRACAVCGDVVDHVVRTDGSERYQHTLASIEDGKDDHLVVPVRYEDIRTNVRCDFCTVDGARWTLPVEPYEVMPGWNSADDWAVCDDCVVPLRANDWHKLSYRALRAHRARGGLSGKRELDALYVQLRRHITGPPHLSTMSDSSS